jgi:hypothetical protein
MNDYSSVITRTERMKNRWMRVIANKEKLSLDSQRQLQNKFEKLIKLERSKKKRREGEIEDLQMLIESRKE